MREYIEAREGFMLTDGATYGKRIYLAEGVDKGKFHEVTESEYNAMQKEMEESNE